MTSGDGIPAIPAFSRLARGPSSLRHAPIVIRRGNVRQSWGRTIQVLRIVRDSAERAPRGRDRLARMTAPGYAGFHRPAGRPGGSWRAGRTSEPAQWASRPDVDS